MTLSAAVAPNGAQTIAVTPAVSVPAEARVQSEGAHVEVPGARAAVASNAESTATAE